MNIKELYEKIKEARGHAEMDITSVPKNIRAATEGNIRSAKVNLVKLENQYRNQIVSEIALISISGKYAKEFSEIAKTKFKTMSFDYLGVAKKVAESVIKRGGRDRYDSHEHWMVMDELNQIKLKYNVLSIPPLAPKFSNQKLLESLEQNFASTYGGSLYSAVLRGDIGTAALEAGFQGKTLPVLIYNYTVPVDEAMIKRPVANIEANEKPTEKSVKSQLVKIKTALKPKNNDPKTKE